MKKIPLFFLSLIGALPGAFLSYLLVMYLINQPSGASSMVMIFAIITLLCSATLAAIPVLVLAMYYSNYDPPREPRPEKASGKKDDDEEAEEAAPEAKAKSADEDDDMVVAEDLESGEFEEMDEEFVEEKEDE